MKCYFTAGYIPSVDLKGILATMNWCSEQGIETVFLSQSLIDRPGKLANVSGAPNMEMVTIPYMTCSEETFLKVFGRAWDLDKVTLIPGELADIKKKEIDTEPL